MKLLPIKMKTWRELEKLNVEIQERDALLSKAIDKLNTVEDDLFFELLSKQTEVIISENNAEIRAKKAAIVAEAYGAKIDKETDVNTLYAQIKREILILLNKKSSEMPEVKESKTNYENMNGYQQVIHLYSILHREYRWTRQTIDSEEIEYIYDLTIVQAIGSEEKETTIESLF